MVPNSPDPASMSSAMRRVRTRCVQGGHDVDDDGVWPIAPPIVTSSAYATHDPDAMSARQERGEPIYNRDQFPNARLLARLVADLEGAELGYAVSSGMAAISLAGLALLSQGDHLVMGADGYSDSEDLLSRELPRFGIESSRVALCDLDAVRAAIRPGTGMIFAETIANPGMTVTDIPALAVVAREHGIPLVIDNSLPSPALCQPVAHGADLVIHSVTKFLGGHHDLSAGVIVGGASWMERIGRVGYLLGAVPGAHDAVMAVRGIRTLVPRMAWISRSAQEIAEYLCNRPEVAAVRYPGLAAGDEGALAARLMPDGYGGVLVVELAGPSADSATDFMRSLRMIPYVSSLGGEITTVCYPPRLAAAHDGQQASGGRSLRFSIGLEDPADLIGDLEQAFDALDR